jgi:phage repressor protein C with HTH and peptisase S24 domain
MMRSQLNATSINYPAMKGDIPKSLRRALRAFMDDRGLNQTAWAKKAGLSESTVRNFLNGDSDSMTIVNYAKLAAAAESSVAELVGEKPAARGIDRQELIALSPGVRQIGNIEYASIGRFDAALSAGPGSLNEDHPEPLGYQLIEQQWLRGITRAAPEHLSVVRIANDSMERTLFDGDWVIVDHTQTRFDHEGIYALQVGMAAWVKRLTLNLREKLIRIISDNQLYPVQELPEEEVRVIGRVISLVARKL